MKDNYTVIEEIFEVDINPAMFDELDVSAIDEIASSISVRSMTEEIPTGAIQTVRTVLSPALALGLLGGAALMLLFVCLIQRFKPVSLLYVGITVLAVAVIPFALTFAMDILEVFIAQSSVSFLTGAVVAVTDMATLYGGVLAAVGVLCIALYIVLRVVGGKRAKAAEAAA